MIHKEIAATWWRHAPLDLSWCHFHCCMFALDGNRFLSVLLGNPQMGQIFEHSPRRGATSTWNHISHKGSLAALAWGKDLQLIQKNSFSKSNERGRRPDLMATYATQMGFLSHPSSICCILSTASYSTYAFFQYAARWLLGMCRQLH